MIDARSAALVALVALVALAACAATRPRSSFAPTETSMQRATVRYQATDVGRSIQFYADHLGFALESRAGDAFAAMTLGPLRLILSGPGSSGSRPMPDGRAQAPGGWTRIVVYVDDLDGRIAELRTAGVSFRNAVETGPGGRQIQIEDPDGNPIELHQPQ